MTHVLSALVGLLAGALVLVAGVTLGGMVQRADTAAYCDKLGAFKTGDKVYTCQELDPNAR